jgi:hypothetical protein
VIGRDGQLSPFPNFNTEEEARLRGIPRAQKDADFEEEQRCDMRNNNFGLVVLAIAILVIGGLALSHERLMPMRAARPSR